jgi:NADH-quinone oxidoreductase subunit E
LTAEAKIKTMLAEEERKEIEAELKKYAQKRAAAIDALKIVQRHRGWISNNSLKDVALFLDMTDDELDSVSTCYNFIFRKPVGRHVILVCDSISCWVTGYEIILKHLEKRLGITFGQTTFDGRFTLLPVVCLGACDKAPVMMIDEDLHGELDPSKIDEILENYK